MTKIKELRIKYSLTQKQLSEITGTSKRNIENWEGGQRKCPEYVEHLIADKLHQLFDTPDYKTILEEILEMMESDLKSIKNTDTKQYVENVIEEIKDSLK